MGGSDGGASGVCGALRDGGTMYRAPDGAALAKVGLFAPSAVGARRGGSRPARGSFPNDEAAVKLLFLAIRNTGLKMAPGG
jgi:hypothetical protein